MYKRGVLPHWCVITYHLGSDYNKLKVKIKFCTGSFSLLIYLIQNNLLLCKYKPSSYMQTI